MKIRHPDVQNVTIITVVYYYILLRLKIEKRLIKKRSCRYLKGDCNYVFYDHTLSRQIIKN